MKRLMRSFSFRLAIAYAVLLSLSMALLFGLYHWVAVREPLQAVRAQVDVEAKALGQLYLARGRWALVAELDRRARAKSERRAFHTLIAGDGTVLTSNLPSWPRRSRADWFSIEADVNHEGDEQDHSAQVRDRTFADGNRPDRKCRSARRRYLREKGFRFATIPSGQKCLQLEFVRQLPSVSALYRRRRTATRVLKVRRSL